MLRWLCTILAGLLVASYASFALLAPVRALPPTTTFHYSHEASTVKLSWPTRGMAAVGAEGFGVLATNGTSAPLPTASTIKVLTALCVLQKYPLQLHQQGPSITITQEDLDSLAKFEARDGSVVRVQLGEQLSEYQALQALLLPSANNIAETLARWAFGSLPAYSTYANTLAASLGMTSTTVTDPSGFAPSTTSTPHDLVLLGEAALQNAIISDVMNQTSAMLPVVGLIHNYNVLLGQHGIIGVKTGNNDQDPGAYIVASQQKIGNKTVALVAAVMNGANLWSTMYSSLPLLDSAAKGFRDMTVVNTGDSVATYRAAWGGHATVVASKSVSMPIWDGSIITSSIRVDRLPVHARSNEVVGTLTIRSSTFGSIVVPLILKQEIPEPSIWWKLLHPVR